MNICLKLYIFFMYNFIEMFVFFFLFGVLNICMSLKYKNKIFIFNLVFNIFM